jgi:sugar phosphate isomerase/epimerase
MRWGDRFAINTYSYTQSMTAVACVRALAERGVRAVELMMYPGHLWVSDERATLRELRRTLEATGVALLSINSPNIDLNLAAATEEMRALTIRLNGEYLRVAGELGAQGLIVGPGKANPLFPLPKATLEGRFFRGLDELLPFADRLGVELWVENMPFAFLPDADGLLGALDRYGSDRIKVCYDVANAHFIGEDPTTGLHKVGSRLRLIHVSDTSRSLYRHDAIGLGDIDFARLAPAIRAAGLPRAPMLEIVSANADRDLAGSIKALDAMGY